MANVIVPDVHDIVDRCMVVQVIRHHHVELAPAPAAENGGGVAEMATQP